MTSREEHRWATWRLLWPMWMWRAETTLRGIIELRPKEHDKRFPIIKQMSLRVKERVNTLQRVKSWASDLVGRGNNDVRTRSRHHHPSIAPMPCVHSLTTQTHCFRLYCAEALQQFKISNSIFIISLPLSFLTQTCHALSSLLSSSSKKSARRLLNHSIEIQFSIWNFFSFPIIHIFLSDREKKAETFLFFHPPLLFFCSIEWSSLLDG